MRPSSTLWRPAAARWRPTTLALLGLTFASLGAHAQNTLIQANFTGVIVPQVMASGTSNRVPVAFRATLNGLTPGAVYRYYVQGATTLPDATNDFGSSNSGAGNPIFVKNDGTYGTTSSTSLTTVGGYDTLVANVNGARTRFFAFINTGNARFTAGNTVFPSITYGLDNPAPTSTTTFRRALNQGIKVLAFVASAGTNNGSYLRGASSAPNGRVAFLYDNTTGTGRPLSGTLVETVVALGTGLISGYSTASGAYNTIIPNANTNGVRYVEVRNQQTGAVTGCAQDADGTWSSGAVTASPTTGTTAIPLTNADAPLTTCGGGPNPLPAVSSLSPTSVVAGSGAFTLTVNGSNFVNGSVVRWNNGNRTTTFVNAGQLTAAITAADVAAVSSASVTVFSPAPGGGTSGALTFNITAPASPTITVTGTPLAAFTGTVGQLSANQSFQVAGSTLSGDVLVTAPTGFQVSQSSGSGFGPSTLVDQADAEAGPVDIYVRYAPGVAGPTSGTIDLTSSGATTRQVPVSGSALATRPTVKSTVSTGTITLSSIVVDFTGGNGQKHLVIARKGFATSFTPVSGTTYPATAAFGTGAALNTDNYAVYNGTGSTVTVTGLEDGTQYFFSVYEFNDDAVAGAENYLTTAPVATTNATTLPAPASTYTWNVSSGNWTTPASWSPTRTVVRNNDILVFDGATVANPTVNVDFTPTGTANPPATAGITVGQLKFVNGVNATLTTTDKHQINIATNQPGTDFVVDATSTLKLQNTVTGVGTYVYITPGHTGQVDGTVILDGTVATASGATNKLIGTNTGSGLAQDGGLVFKPTATLVAGRNFSGNAFGDQTAFLNGTVFESGAIYRQLGGSNAFGLSSPSSVVYFAPGSVYRYEQWNATPAASGRTYPTLIIDIDLTGAPGGTTAAPNLTGSSAFTVTGDLRILRATSVTIATTPMELQGNLVVNVPTTISTTALTFSGANTSITGTAPLTLSGSLTVSGNLDASAATLLFNGPVARTITGAGTLALGTATTGTNQLTLGVPTTLRRLLTLGAGNVIGNGNLTLLSDATATAMVVNAGAGAVLGNSTVQRWIDPSLNPGRGYRHFSAPVAGTTIGDLATAQFTPFVNPGYNTLPAPSLPPNVFPTVFAYDETRGGATNSSFNAGYFSPASLADAMEPGRGYAVYFPGSQTPDFVGTLGNGTVSRNGLTKTGSFTGNTQKSGWHMLGNPYPSPLDWDLVTVPAGMSKALSMWRSTGPSDAGTYTVYTNGIGAIGADLVPMAQGFFVRVTGNTPVNFNFTNAARVTSYQNPAHYRAGADTRPLLALGLHAVGAPAVATDEAFVYFETGATTDLDDDFDGLKPQHNVGVPTLVSRLGGQELAINGLDPALLVTGTRVPLLLDLPRVGAYTFDVTQLRQLAGVPVRLLDLKLNTVVDLAAQASYTFRAAQTGVEATRFVLEFGQRVTGLTTAAATAGLVVYPNPAHGALAVSVPADLLVTRATLTDALGRVVATPALPTGATTTLSVAGLPVGVYALRFETSAGTVSRRVVVE